MSYSTVLEHRTCWYNDEGDPHREDGPAMIWNDGQLWWCINDTFHRTDGPAIYCPNKPGRWFINGNEFSTKEQWFAELTHEQKDNYIWNL